MKGVVKDAMRSPRRIVLGVLPAAVLLLVSGWDVIATLGSGGDTANAPAWRQAAKVVRADYQPGDLIVFSPRWIDPIGRQHLGDLIPLEVAGRMDNSAFARIWEISVGAGQHADTKGLTTSREKRFGELRLRQYRKKAAQVSTDFVRAFSAARKEGSHLRAPMVDLASIAFEARRCIRLVVDTAGTARVVYAEALLGKEIVGYAGLVDEFPRLRKRSERGQLKLLVNGEARAQIEITGRWTPFVAKTAPNTRAEVAFEVSASGPARPPRLICFAAQARR